MVDTMAAGKPRRGLPAKSYYRGVVGYAALFAVWELLPSSGIISERYFPPFHQVFVALMDDFGDGSFWSAVGVTVEAWFLGLGIAFGAAVAVGLIIGSVPLLWRYAESTIEFLRPIPSVALIPLAVLIYGITMRSALLLIVYASFWQVLIQILYGVKDIDPVATDTARVFGLSRWSRIRHVAWPSALPYGITGFRLGASVALVLAVTAQMVIGNPGIGYQIALAQSGLALPRMYSLVIMTGLMGVAVNVLARLAERRLLRWHQASRGERS